MGTPKITVRAGNPDFLDLPWETPINDWDNPRLVEMPTGVHRHPVVFVAYDEGIYAIKELSAKLAHNEYTVLAGLEERTHRAAEPVGLVERGWFDPHVEGAGAVITRFVEHGFPYRRLVSGPGFGVRRNQLIDALASLIVELHLLGCFWGDCSLSNVLYRYDAGGIEAIMIDAETSEVHSELTDGRRQEDLSILVENLAGEMADIAAMSGANLDEADLSLGEDVAGRYQALWNELNEDLVINRDESYKVRERIGRLNDLGFSVQDIEITPAGDGQLVKLQTHVGGRTYNSDSLAQLTGIEASENQAKLILSDLNYHLVRASEYSRTERSIATFGWLTTVYEPMIKRISDNWPGGDPVQGYCDYLYHRLELATSAGTDVSNEAAFESWVANDFPGFPLGAEV